MERAEILVDLRKESGIVDRKLFGHFMEHAFGNIYGGIYDPGNKNAGPEGLREDVIKLLKRVRPSILRYPGGNFVSNYHWEDGIGPKENRRVMFDYAWQAEESNQFGTVDFINLCRKLNAEPCICVNMGTGTIEEAMHWVEYCNGTENTYYANLRRQHGYEEPFNVKYWGLGNEVYGDWQMGYKNAEDYAKAAFEFAKAMLWVDSSIKLIACGYEKNSDWNTVVVKKLNYLIDYVSAHHYSVGWGIFDKENYLQCMYISEYMQKLTDVTVAAIRTATNDNKNRIKVAWDEWNMYGWKIDGINDDLNYTLQNAIVTASVLNMFKRNCNTVGMANYSTFLNINGAIRVDGDEVVLRPQYHVFDLLSNNTGENYYLTEVASNTFSIVEPRDPKSERTRPRLKLDHIDSSPPQTVEAKYIDAVATGDKDGSLYISLVNKHPDEDIDVEIYFHGKDIAQNGSEAYEIYHEDVKAANTVSDPENVKIKRVEAPVVSNGYCNYRAKKHSINLLKFKVSK